MKNNKRIQTPKVQELAKQEDGEALYQMVWLTELMPFPDSGNGVEICAWQDFWFEKAADAGHIKAMSTYAHWLATRIFDKNSRQKAKKYFESLTKDFDNGNLQDDLEIYGIIAKFWLGIMLCQGLGIERDEAEGVRLLKEADTLTNGFDKFVDRFDYAALSVLAETYGEGHVNTGGEPSSEDLKKARDYQIKAIERFNPEKNDPNNRGIRKLAHQYRDLLKERIPVKESQEESAAVFGIDITENPDFKEWQKRMMTIPPAAQQRLNANKTALERLQKNSAILYKIKEEKERKEREEHEEQIRIEEQNRKAQYDKLLSKKETALSWNEFESLSHDFRAMQGYEDTAALAEECSKLAVEVKDDVYNKLIESKNNEEAKTDHDIEEFCNLAQKFRELGTEYKDVYSVANDCVRIALAQEKKDLYNALVKRMQNTSSENDFKVLAIDFRSMGDYPNASANADECDKHCQELKDERIGMEYSNASAEMQRLEQHKVRKPDDLRKSAKEWEQLSNRFKVIAEYKDAAALVKECEQKSTAASRKAEIIEKRNERIPSIIGWLAQTVVLAVFLSLLLKTDYVRSISFGSFVERNYWGDISKASFLFYLLLFLPIFCFGLTEKLIGTITRTKNKIFLLTAIIAQTVIFGDWGRLAFYDINHIPYYYPEIGLQIALSLFACTFGYLAGLVIARHIKPYNAKVLYEKFKGESLIFIVVIILTVLLGVSLLFNIVDMPVTAFDTSTHFNQIETRVTEAIPYEYIDAKNFSQGLAAVKKGNLLGGKWGFIDKEGNEVIPSIYSAAESFSNGMALVRKGNGSSGKWIYIDKKGNEIGIHKEDPSTRTNASGTNYDTEGNDVFPTYYEQNYSDGLKPIREDGKWGFQDPLNHVIIPCIYDLVSAFKEGMAAIEIDDKWGYVNTDGTEVISPAYDSVTVFSDGVAIVSQNGMFGVIDKNGTVVTPFVYDSASSFSNDVVVAMRDNVQDFIDTKGNVIGSFVIDRSIYYIHEQNNLPSLANKTITPIIAVRPKNTFVFDKFHHTLEYLLNIIAPNSAVYTKEEKAYSGVNPFYMNEMAVLQLQKFYTKDRYKYGFINEAGEEVVPFIYDNSIIVSEGMAAVKYRGKWGFLSFNAELSNINAEPEEIGIEDIYD